jgi:hypothetical protein
MDPLPHPPQLHNLVKSHACGTFAPGVALDNINSAGS